MSTGIESELRAAFEGASGAIVPRADLAALVRAATRRRRRRLAVSAVLAGALIVAGTSYAAAALHQGGHRPASRRVHKHRGPHWARPVRLVSLPAGADVQAMATAGSYLYVTTDHAGEPPYALAAYRLAAGWYGGSAFLLSRPRCAPGLAGRSGWSSTPTRPAARAAPGCLTPTSASARVTRTACLTSCRPARGRRCCRLSTG